MNKKRLIYLIAIFATVILFVFVWLLISFLNNKKVINEKMSDVNYSNLPAREVADWDKPFLREIKVEFIEKAELDKMGLARDPMYRLQVLERDASGKVISYKKVYRDDEIITHVYDPSNPDSANPELTATTTVITN